MQIEIDKDYELPQKKLEIEEVGCEKQINTIFCVKHDFQIKLIIITSHSKQNNQYLIQHIKFDNKITQQNQIPILIKVYKPKYTHVIITMFSSFRRGLKAIDFYQAVPSQYSQGTISGACISVAAISLLIFLVTSAVLEFQSPTVDSDLIIDQKHLDQKLKVHIDIQFKRYPCSFLSLDVENVLKVHLVNVMDNLVKISLPDGELYSDKGMDDQAIFQRVVKDIQQQKGCRMKGFFQIDRVPGNFHFSSHGYNRIVPQLVNSGYRMFDMSHHIYELRFGEEKTQFYGENSLQNFNSEKFIEESFLGITYTYFLDIIEQNVVHLEGKQSYMYTARLNEVVLAQLPMVYFKYQTNPMTVLHIMSGKQWHTLFIEIVGIIGGIFTVATILDHMIHSSIHFLVKKHMLNKLR